MALPCTDALWPRVCNYSAGDCAKDARRRQVPFRNPPQQPRLRSRSWWRAHAAATDYARYAIEENKDSQFADRERIGLSHVAPVGHGITRADVVAHTAKAKSRPFDLPNVVGERRANASPARRRNDAQAIRVWNLWRRIDIQPIARKPQWPRRDPYDADQLVFLFGDDGIVTAGEPLAHRAPSTSEPCERLRIRGSRRTNPCWSVVHGLRRQLSHAIKQGVNLDQSSRERGAE